MTLTSGTENRDTGSDVARRMSSSPHAWCRRAPTSSTCIRRTRSSTGSLGSTRIRRGTTLTSIPADRRSSAVVRADTGMFTSTSYRPDRREKKQAAAASTTAAEEASRIAGDPDR